VDLLAMRVIGKYYHNYPPIISSSAIPIFLSKYCNRVTLCGFGATKESILDKKDDTQ
jgi:hypothetical protein